MIKKRILKKYPTSLPYKKDESYKIFYLKLIHYIDKIKEEYKFDFTNGNPIAYYNLLNSKTVKLWKIRESIQHGYIDLALFLSEKEKPIDNRMLLNLFLLSARMGNKFLVNYYLKMGNFGEYEYNKAADHAELGGHFELEEYLKSLKI